MENKAGFSELVSWLAFSEENLAFSLHSKEVKDIEQNKGSSGKRRATGRCTSRYHRLCVLWTRTVRDKIAGVLNSLVDYDGFGASIVKAFLVVLMAGAILYPVWGYALIWLPLAQSTTIFWQWVIYIGVCAQFIAVMVTAIIIGYIYEEH